MIEIGSAAPDFTLPGGAGVVSLGALRGQKVVLYFYPKDDTSGCTQEAKEFDALRAEFEASGTAVVGLSPDGPKSKAKFAAKHGLGLTLAADEAKTTLQAYGVWAEKSMYGRKYMGTVRTTFLIDENGLITDIIGKVDTQKHAEQILK